MNIRQSKIDAARLQAELLTELGDAVPNELATLANQPDQTPPERAQQADEDIVGSDLHKLERVFGIRGFNFREEKVKTFGIARNLPPIPKVPVEVVLIGHYEGKALAELLGKGKIEGVKHTDGKKIEHRIKVKKYDAPSSDRFTGKNR